MAGSGPSLAHKHVLSPGVFCLSPHCCCCQATLLPCLRDSLLMLQNWKFASQAPSAVSCIRLLKVALVEAFLPIPGVSVEQPRRDLDILLRKREVSPWTRKTPSTARGQTCPSWNRTEICCRLISIVFAAIFYLCQVLFLH